MAQDEKQQHRDTLSPEDAPAPGDALGIEDMGADNRSNFVRPKRERGTVASPAFPRTRE